MTVLDRAYIESVVARALAEDVGSGDITTVLTVPEDAKAAATITAKARGVIAGLEVARAVFLAVEESVEFTQQCREGAGVDIGDPIAYVAGSARSILTAERVALNFLGRMSGVASVTSRYVKIVSHTSVRIVDTRKTTPGLRRLEKYAVAVGGGYNHRFGLSDGILIKDNHIAAAGGIGAAVSAAKSKAPHTLKIEVEVTNLDELREAIDTGADAVLLDNMPLDDMAEAVRIAAGRVITEASGGVSESTAAAIAETGVDIISVGALTHSVPALDLSLNFD